MSDNVYLSAAVSDDLHFHSRCHLLIQFERWTCTGYKLRDIEGSDAWDRAASRLYPATSTTNTRVALDSHPATSTINTMVAVDSYPATSTINTMAAIDSNSATSTINTRADVDSYPTTSTINTRAALDSYPPTAKWEGLSPSLI
ncbi:hypothetical protein J6590_002904 [Homalodisca vitripennis]|nr:hypothetical protein J6590_002904 [Homalodisca vitripennis]